MGLPTSKNHHHHQFTSMNLSSCEMNRLNNNDNSSRTAFSDTQSNCSTIMYTRSQLFLLIFLTVIMMFLLTLIFILILAIVIEDAQSTTHLLTTKYNTSRIWPNEMLSSTTTASIKKPNANLTRLLLSNNFQNLIKRSVNSKYFYI